LTLNVLDFYNDSPGKSTENVLDIGISWKVLEFEINF